MDESDNPFDADAYPHLLRLREALWAGPYESRVSVMVGAGFSKNAMPLDPAGGMMPDWNGLATLLSKELTPDDALRQQVERDMGSVSEGYMRLAQYYEAKFARPALDEFIRDSIADALFEPGLAHETLLNLPWREVFTTNWDTLLERAADDLRVDRLYFPVADDAQILTAGTPRITKLHGCVQRGDNYVFTEEDYRLYPQRHPVFITVVREALVEGPMVLFGFSGEDPNFRSWVGWMRDVLRSTHGIFLLDFSGRAAPEFMTRRLADQGVTVLRVGKPNVAIAESLQRVLSFLGERPASNWPEARRHAFSAERIDESFQAYPGWLLCPRDSRAGLDIRSRMRGVEKSLPSLPWQKQLAFVAHRMFFLNLTGMGVPSDEAAVVDRLLSEGAVRPLIEVETKQWLTLLFARLTSARLDLDFDAYERTRALLTASPTFRHVEIANRLHLSDAVLKLVQLDRAGAMEHVRAVRTADPHLHLRALALRLEIEGASGIQSELDSLKRRIWRLARERPTDIRYASLDDVLREVDRNIAAVRDPKIARIPAVDFRSDMRRGMRCDVVGELNFLIAVIDAVPQRVASGPQLVPSFSAGTYQRNLHFIATSSPAPLLSAYLMARAPDDVGLPISIGNAPFLVSALDTAGKWLAEFDPAAALAVALRLLANGHVNGVKRLTRHDVALFNRPLVLRVWSFTMDALTREMATHNGGEQGLLKGALYLATKLVIRTDESQAERLWAAILTGSWGEDSPAELERARAAACVEASHLLPRTRIRETLGRLAREILAVDRQDEKKATLVVNVARGVDMDDPSERNPELLDAVVAALTSNDEPRRAVGVQMLSVMTTLFQLNADDKRRVGDALWHAGDAWPNLGDNELADSNRGFVLQWSGAHRDAARKKLVEELEAATEMWKIVLLAAWLAWRDDDESISDWRASFAISEELLTRIRLAVAECAKDRIKRQVFGSVDYPSLWRNALGRLLAPLHAIDAADAATVLSDAKRCDLWAPSVVLELYRAGVVPALDLLKAVIAPGDDADEWNRLDCLYEIIKSNEERFEQLGDRMVFLMALSNPLTSPKGGPDTAHAIWVGTWIVRARPDLVKPITAAMWFDTAARISKLRYGPVGKDGQVTPDLRRSAAALLHALIHAGKVDRDSPEVASSRRSFAEDELPEVKREVEN